MKSIATLALSIALLVSCADAKPITDADKKKVDDAALTEPVVKPSKARKVLIFSRTTGFRHGSIETGVYAFKKMGETSGAYTADATEDPAVFTDDNLKQYDAIVFLNTTGEPVPDAAGREAVEKFVANGKGLIGIHSASDTGYKWENYGKMIGGYFAGHPWNAGSNVTIKIEGTDHAINKAAGFEGDTFVHKDEIYQYRPMPYSRENLRILLSLDLTGPNMKRGGMKRADNDYAVAWLNTFGKGRIYYNNLGHNHHTFWTPAVMRHFLAGIQFACGDLDADTTPSAALKK